MILHRNKGCFEFYLHIYIDILSGTTTYCGYISSMHMSESYILNFHSYWDFILGVSYVIVCDICYMHMHWYSFWDYIYFSKYYFHWGYDRLVNLNSHICIANMNSIKSCNKILMHKFCFAYRTILHSQKCRFCIT